MEKGILTPAQEKQLSEMLDNVLKLKGFLELVDGFLAKILVTILDDVVVDKLKVDVKIKLAALVDAVFAKNVPLAEDLASQILNDLVDIPGIEEGAEGLIFKGAIELIVGAILNKLEEVKGDTVSLKKK